MEDGMEYGMEYRMVWNGALACKTNCTLVHYYTTSYVTNKLDTLDQ